jgi:hypothetical protein
MTGGAARERYWLRPLGLLAVGLALAVGQPFVLVAVPFALLAFLMPGAGVGGLLLGALALALVFAGEPGSGFWYVERGWAILVGGWFVAVSLAWPHRPFFSRALYAVAGGSFWSGAILLALGGWASVEWLVAERIQASAVATLEVVRLISGQGADQGLTETVMATARAQGVLFPALLGLSTLATLGVAWWAHLKVATGSSGGLGALRNFRFPDPMIWVLIAGLLLLLLAGWSQGWGRLGANLAVFMGGLYALRGAAVLLFLAGGASVLTGIVVAVGMILAGPLLLTAAMAVGVGDSWLDLRARQAQARGDGTDR